MQSTLFGDHADAVKPLEKDLSDALKKLAPTLDKQRLSGWQKKSQVEAGHPMGDFDAIFKLKKNLYLIIFRVWYFQDN